MSEQRSKAWSDPQWLTMRHEHLANLGLLDPGEPTPYSHALYELRTKGEFTPEERASIRFQLGLIEDTP